MKKIRFFLLLLILVLGIFNNTADAQHLTIKNVRVVQSTKNGKPGLKFLVSFQEYRMPFFRMSLNVERPKGRKEKDTNPEFETIQISEPFDLDEDGYYKDIEFFIEGERFFQQAGKIAYWAHFKISVDWEDRQDLITNDYFPFTIDWDKTNWKQWEAPENSKSSSYRSTPQIQQPVPCAVCSGVRRCPSCNGKGQYYSSNRYHLCGICNGTGICANCHGTGIQPY